MFLIRWLMKNQYVVICMMIFLESLLIYREDLENMILAGLEMLFLNGNWVSIAIGGIM